METKHEDQMKPELQDWQFSNSLVHLLGILAPAAFLAILLGHSGIFIDFILNTEYSKRKGHRASNHAKPAPNIDFYSWFLNFVSCLTRSRLKKSNINAATAKEIWHDGSLLCNLVNMTIPGACKDPRAHRLQTPDHGQKLVYEYMDIKPIFSAAELSQSTLSPSQEKKFTNYLNKIHEIISKHNDQINNMKFSTDYVARGMGLVVAQQNRKATFYIYPIPKRYQTPCDIEVFIKGPCGNNGKIVIPSILHSNQKYQQRTDYRRALYMTSKINSISPTIQGSSFLRKLSLTPDIPSEMDIRVKVTPTRAKVTYIPQKTGIYEISLITRGNHVVGSPYSVPVELSTVSNYCSNDSDNDSDEEQNNKYINRKKKIISRIVDFIDEKMLLQDDGTLIKIDANTNAQINTKKNNNIILKKQVGFNIDNDSNSNLNHTSDCIKNFHKYNLNSELKKNENEELINYTLDDKNNNKSNNFITLKSETDNLSNNYLIINGTRNNSNDSYYKTLNENNNDITLTQQIKKTDLLGYNDLNSIKNNSVAPDILEIPYNSNSSALFTEVNNSQMQISPIQTDPTLDSKVQDPETDSSVAVLISNKSFSIKDPTSDITENNCLVNNLIKIFDTSTCNNNNQKSFKNNSCTTGNISSLDKDPDLVKCHVKQSQFNNYESLLNNNENNELQNKLNKIGAISKGFDKHQCNLKLTLNKSLQQYMLEKNKTECIIYNLKEGNPETTPKSKLGIVEKQKQFWQKRSTISRDENDINKSPKKLINLKSSFITVSTDSKNKENTKLESNISFEGIVENKIKIFETKLQTPKVNIYTKEINSKNTVCNMLKLDEKEVIKLIPKSDERKKEEIVKIPSLEERKSKFFKACSKSTSYNKKRRKLSDNKIHSNFTKEENKIKIIADKKIDKQYVSQQMERKANSGAENKDKIKSVRRKTRFQRAKQYFESLENVISRLDMDLNSKFENFDPDIDLNNCDIFSSDELNSNETELNNNLVNCTTYIPKSYSDPENIISDIPKQYDEIPRSVSDPCVSLNKNIKPVKITERFQVDDLFQDILEDSRFIGMPNKKAVVASLASLDNSTSEAKIESSLNEIPNLNYFKERPKQENKTDNNIPGFHKEYPYIPKSQRWKYSKSNLNESELIPGRKLLHISNENIEI